MKKFLLKYHLTYQQNINYMAGAQFLFQEDWDASACMRHVLEGIIEAHQREHGYTITQSQICIDLMVPLN